MNIINTPGKIGPLTLKNRITMAPMGLHLGKLCPEVVDFFKARVDGGVGMIQINCMATDAIEDASASMLITDENLHYLKELVDYAHEHDCRITLQIMLGCGRVGGPSAKYGGMPVAASAVSWHHYAEMICQEITHEDIELLKSAFRDTVRRGVEAGIDGVEMHAYGGYLMDQFLTERWNKRTDEYGGSLENRMRLLNETIDIAREVGGKKLAILVKYTPDHYMDGDGYRHIDEGIEIARRLEARGVDALHVCAGCYDNWENAMPPIYFQELTKHIRSARTIKEYVGIPVIVHGRLSNPEKAVSVLEKGYADFVAIGRGLLADPELPNKLAAESPREILPCISCNEGCIARVYMGQRCTCAINPFCGYEAERVIPPAAQHKRVLVIGGGPGGCSAAIYAKLAGHDVELWEKQPHLGGNAYVASMPVFKRDMEALSQYYEEALPRLGVRVKYLRTADVESVRAYAPDHIIWATGGVPVRPASIPGIFSDNVVMATDALKNLDLLGNRLAVIGGGLVGCETAAHFSLLGKDVSVVEMAPAILPEELFPQNRSAVMRWIDVSGLKKYEGCKLTAIDSEGVSVEKDGTELRIPCDTVVIAMGFKPNTEAAEPYREICPVNVIGDAAEPRKILYAVSEARDAVAGI